MLAASCKTGAGRVPAGAQCRPQSLSLLRRCHAAAAPAPDAASSSAVGCSTSGTHTASAEQSACSAAAAAAAASHPQPPARPLVSSVGNTEQDKARRLTAAIQRCECVGQLAALHRTRGAHFNHIHVAAAATQAARLAGSDCSEPERAAGAALAAALLGNLAADEQLLGACGLRELGHALWAAATLRLSLDKRALSRLLAAVSGRLDGLDGTAAQLQPQLLQQQRGQQHCVRRAVDGAGGASPQSLANIAWAAAALGVGAPCFWDRLLGAAAAHVPAMHEQELVNTLWAAAAAQQRHAAFTQAACAHMLAACHRWSDTKALSSAAWALAKLGARRMHARQGSQHSVQRCGVAEAAGQEGEAEQSAAGAGGERLMPGAQADAQGAAYGASAACALLAAAQRCAQLAHRLSAEELAALLSALAHARCKPPRALLARAAECAPGAAGAMRVTTAVNLLHALALTCGGAPAGRLLAAALCRRLASQRQEQQRQGVAAQAPLNAGDITTALWALARLAPAGHEDGDVAAAVAVGAALLAGAALEAARRGGMSAERLAMAASAAARLRLRDGGLYAAAAAAAAAAPPPGLGLPWLSLLAWALGSARQPASPGLLDALTAGLVRAAGEAPPLELARLAWGYARLGGRDAAALAMLADAIEARGLLQQPGVTALTLAGLATPLAAAGMMAARPALAGSLAEAVAALPARMLAGGVGAELAGALAGAGVYHAPAFARLASGAVSAPACLTWERLSVLLRAFAAARHATPSLLHAAAGAGAAMLAAAPHTSAGVRGGAAAAAGLDAASGWEVAPSAGEAAAAWQPGQVAGVLYSLAVLGYGHAGLWAAAAAALRPLPVLAELATPHLAQLLWAAAACSAPALPRYWDAAAAAGSGSGDQHGSSSGPAAATAALELAAVALRHLLARGGWQAGLDSASLALLSQAGTVLHDAFGAAGWEVAQQDTISVLTGCCDAAGGGRTAHAAAAAAAAQGCALQCWKMHQGVLLCGESIQPPQQQQQQQPQKQPLRKQRPRQRLRRQQRLQTLAVEALPGAAAAADGCVPLAPDAAAAAALLGDVAAHLQRLGWRLKPGVPAAQGLPLALDAALRVRGASVGLLVLPSSCTCARPRAAQPGQPPPAPRLLGSAIMQLAANRALSWPLLLVAQDQWDALPANGGRRLAWLEQQCAAALAAAATAAH